MSIQSGRFDRSQVRFHHGRPVPGTPFAQFCDTENISNNRHWPHPPKPDVLLSQGPYPPRINTLALSSHSATTLQLLLERSTREPIFISSFQREAIEQLFSIRRQHLMFRNRLEEESIFDAYYAALDSIFFNSLQGLCKIIILPHESLGPKVGLFSPPGSDNIPENYAGLIEIEDSKIRRANWSQERRVHDYIETLMHEMLHAYFDIYVCVCDETCRSEKTRALGEEGHGVCWQWAALAMERRSEILLGRRFFMLRKESWEEESDEYRAGVGKDEVRRLRLGN